MSLQILTVQHIKEWTLKSIFRLIATKLEQNHSSKNVQRPQKHRFTRLARSNSTKNIFTIFASFWKSNLCSKTVVQLRGQVTLDLHTGYTYQPVTWPEDHVTSCTQSAGHVTGEEGHVTSLTSWRAACDISARSFGLPTIYERPIIELLAVEHTINCL